MPPFLLLLLLLVLLALRGAPAAAAAYPACGAAKFSRNMSGVEVAGLALAPAATDATSCLAACCAAAAPQCSVWQWCPGGLECGAAPGCWLGALGGATAQRAGWVSFATPSDCRDPLVRPFSADTVWNVAVGEQAAFAPAHLFPDGASPSQIFVDEDFFAVARDTDPLIPWYEQGWNCTPNCALMPWAPFVESVRWPEPFLITPNGNNALALLQPDGDSLFRMYFNEKPRATPHSAHLNTNPLPGVTAPIPTPTVTQPAYHCVVGGPLLSMNLTTEQRTAAGSLRGNGNLGGHGGSDLSALGGALRVGELLPGAESPGPLHALKLELWAKQYYFGTAFGANASTCFRWPAATCDGYFADPQLYNGSDPRLVPGALLALTADGYAGLALATAPAKQLAWTLRNFGGYLVDDTYSNQLTFAAERGFQQGFAYAWGFEFGSNPASPGAGAAFYADVLAIARALMIVDSNSAAAPGGGGTPLQPPPPGFCEY